MLLERGLLPLTGQGNNGSTSERGGADGGGGEGERELAPLLLIDPGMGATGLFNGSNVMATRARRQLEAVLGEGNVWIWHDYFANRRRNPRANGSGVGGGMIGDSGGDAGGGLWCLEDLTVG